VIKLAAMVGGIDSKSAPCEFVGALTDEFSAHPGASLAVVVEFAQSLYLDFVGPAQIVEF